MLMECEDSTSTISQMDVYLLNLSMRLDDVFMSYSVNQPMLAKVDIYFKSVTHE